MGFFDSLTNDTYGTNPSEQERQRAIMYAKRALGQKLLEAGMSGNWADYGKNIVGGMGEFRDTYRKSLEFDDKKRKEREEEEYIKGQRVTKGKMDEFQLKKLELEEKRAQMEERRKKTMLPAFRGGLDAAKEEVNKSPFLSEDQKKVLHSKIDRNMKRLETSLTEDEDGNLIPDERILDVVNRELDEVGEMIDVPSLSKIASNEADRIGAIANGFVKKDENGNDVADFEAIEQFRIGEAKKKVRREGLSEEHAIEQIKELRARRVDREKEKENEKKGISSAGITQITNNVMNSIDVFKTIDPLTMDFEDPKIQQILNNLGVMANRTEVIRFGKALAKNEDEVVRERIARIMKIRRMVEEAQSGAPAPQAKEAQVGAEPHVGIGPKNVFIPKPTEGPSPYEVQQKLGSGLSKKAIINNLTQEHNLSMEFVMKAYPFLFE